MNADELRRIRRFLGISQILVSVATGISVYRLSGVENGRLVLNRTERTVLENYYKSRMALLAESKREGAR